MRLGSVLQQAMQGLGPLRVMLIGLAVIVVVLSPSPGTRPILHGWGMFPTLIIPVLAPLTLMGLLLDTLMARVMLGDKQGEDRDWARRAIRLNLAASAVLLVVWLPYFLAIW